MPSPISRWLLPVPESPSSTTGSPRSKKLPERNIAMVAGFTSGAAVRSNSSSSFSRGKLAAFTRRWRRRSSRSSVSAQSTWAR